MSSNSPLDEVWKIYEVTKDCLKVTSRVLRSNDEKFICPLTCPDLACQKSLENYETLSNRSSLREVMS
jgi:hypothetical protein